MDKLTCCEKCHIYWTCETKWYRGERDEDDICCKACNFYNKCLNEGPCKKTSKND